MRKLNITKKVENLPVNKGFTVTGVDYKTMQSHLLKTAKRLGFKIVTRTLDEGLRVWRIQ